MGLKQAIMRELKRVKKNYITPAVDTVRTIPLRSYTSGSKPSSALMHDAGILDAAGVNLAKDYLKKKLAQSHATLDSMSHIFSGDARTAGNFKDSLKSLRNASTDYSASKYKYKNIDLKNKLMAKGLFVVPSAIIADRMFTNGHAATQDQD